MIDELHGSTQALTTLGGIVVLNATVVSYDYVFRFCAIVFVLSIPTVLLLQPAKSAAGEMAVLE